MGHDVKPQSQYLVLEWYRCETCYVKSDRVP